MRDFIELGELTQSIDTEKQLAVNTVGFCVSGLGMLRGALAIEASYQAVSATRVNIDFQSASLVRGCRQCVKFPPLFVSLPHDVPYSRG